MNSVDPRRKVFAALLAALLMAPVAASASPVVTVSLSGVYVGTNADGSPHLVPLDQERAHPGDRIRWEITAANSGDKPARGLVASGRITAGTAFVAGSGSPNGARVEYSLDGGRTWSPAPTVVVQTPAGLVVRKADPGRYTAIRWVGGAPLSPGSANHYTYEVTVR
jgi:uncharacterized repeat protein (TIGR01451 family)